tara:strand:+ start:150 stop:1115 length:966 start_codon:yes stop_codon:yes gene_type:complete
MRDYGRSSKKILERKGALSQEELYVCYEKVSLELERGEVDRGIWAKSFADARGDEQVTKAIYIELKVEALLSKRKSEGTHEKPVVEEAKEKTSKQPKRSIARSKLDLQNMSLGDKACFFVSVTAVAIFLADVGTTISMGLPVKLSEVFFGRFVLLYVMMPFSVWRLIHHGYFLRESKSSAVFEEKTVPQNKISKNLGTPSPDQAVFEAFRTKLPESKPPPVRPDSLLISFLAVACVLAALLLTIYFVPRLSSIQDNRIAQEDNQDKSSLAESRLIIATKQDLGVLAQALEVYRLDNGHYPSTDQGLNALVRKPIGLPAPRN